MVGVRVYHSANQELADAVLPVLARSQGSSGEPALSDHLAFDLASGGGEGFVAVTATDDAGHVVAYAQASTANDNHVLEFVVDPSRAARWADLARSLVGATLAAIRERGGGLVNWWVASPTAEIERLAGQLGLTESKRLFQMCRPLPTGRAVDIATRSFVIGRDDTGVLAVNNRAFAGHGEQGGWTLDTLRRRFDEEWFDAAGVRVHEREGRIAAFCWTKIHPPSGDRPALGEIYVIAVDPDLHGRGLGRQMTLAGLEHLAGRGVTVGMLWVDADNAAAVHLYEQLGFAVETTKVAYTIDLEPAPPPSSPRTEADR